MATGKIQKIRPYQYKRLALDKINLRYGLLLVFLAVSLLLWLVFYCISPYWYSRDFVQQLSQNNLALAETLVPPALLQPNQADFLASQQPISQQWQGPGAHYLTQVWPRVAEQQNMYQLMLLHFNSIPTDHIQHHYSRFPTRFRLTVGDSPQNTLWFEWRRESWNSWQLSRVCIYNPHPVVEVNNCRSSSR